MPKKITIIRLRRPLDKTINSELQWLGSCLGLCSLRDKDKSCFRLFIELMKSTKQGKSLSSDQLASKLKLTRGTVIHHIHSLEDAGIVVYENRGYMLSDNNLKNLIRGIELDIKNTLDQMKTIADDIDDRLGVNRKLLR